MPPVGWPCNLVVKAPRSHMANHGLSTGPRSLRNTPGTWPCVPKNPERRGRIMEEGLHHNRAYWGALSFPLSLCLFVSGKHMHPPAKKKKVNPQNRKGKEKCSKGKSYKDGASKVVRRSERPEEDGSVGPAVGRMHLLVPHWAPKVTSSEDWGPSWFCSGVRGIYLFRITFIKALETEVQVQPSQKLKRWGFEGKKYKLLFY